MFNFPTTCGQDDAIGLGDMCFELSGAEATCSSSPQARTVRRASRLALREDNAVQYDYCDPYTSICFNTINANEFGVCPSGYRSHKIEVDGHLPGVQCSKPCTEEHRREQCAKFPANVSLCSDALMRCRSIPPVAMANAACVDVVEKMDKKQFTCKGTVSYSDGTCTLDEAKYIFAAVAHSIARVGRRN